MGLQKKLFVQENDLLLKKTTADKTKLFRITITSNTLYTNSPITVNALMSQVLTRKTVQIPTYT